MGYPHTHTQHNWSVIRDVTRILFALEARSKKQEARIRIALVSRPAAAASDSGSWLLTSRSHIPLLSSGISRAEPLASYLASPRYDLFNSPIVGPTLPAMAVGRFFLCNATLQEYRVETSCAGLTFETGYPHTFEDYEQFILGEFGDAGLSGHLPGANHFFLS